jgi:hypothetical protein
MSFFLIRHCTRYEDVWRSGGIAPYILILQVNYQLHAPITIELEAWWVPEPVMRICGEKGNLALAEN